VKENDHRSAPAATFTLRAMARASASSATGTIKVARRVVPVAARTTLPT
jgi:hypothetical protein